MTMTLSPKKLLPFLAWFPLRGDTLKADFLAGLTVALVLVPQSMAYAQLAGLPPYYGLYAAFLPVMVAALWGSSHQLGTGPVAVASLLTASSLSPLAAPGSEQFVALAIMLALLVGIVQLTLGVFKLGVIVNFLSHPVIVGFTNAAAMIIGLSQVNKLIGVPMGRSEHFINDIWGVARQVGDTHPPTLAMGATAIVIMYVIRKKAPRLPGVLIAVAVTIIASWLLHFETNASGRVEQIADVELRTMVEKAAESSRKVEATNKALLEKATAAKAAHKTGGGLSVHGVNLDAEADIARIEVQTAEKEAADWKKFLRGIPVARGVDETGRTVAVYPAAKVPPEVKTDGAIFRIRGVGKDGFKLVGGGEVVGGIPEGLPSIGLPNVSWDMLGSLLAAAIVISLVGFMEAISIAKAIAAKTKQKIDPNQELIGQGLANLVGSFSQAFPVSGSFSRSAVNINAGAKTGMSSVFTGLLVLLTLLFLTPLLYHLPQAVLAAVIIMAVIGLINFGAVKHAWQANRHDGIASVVTFVATLAFAPHLDKGIMVGAGLAIVLYLYRTMTPRVAILGRHSDGTLRDARVHQLPASDVVTAVRFDGRLYFANVAFFEDAILDAVASNPEAPYLLVVADGINELDASGEEVIHHLVERLRGIGVVVLFSGLKKQVLDVMQATGLRALIGEKCIFATSDKALEKIYSRAENISDEDALRPVAG
ncbi:MAG: SulP family inorganic anion transporter [Sulfurisoma sp.]|nr:SulP family inorganic anion transporter [Sulfurisoma sp.]